MSSTEVPPPQSVNGTRDKFLVTNKDPNYQYRWINKNLDHHVSERLTDGWEPVRGSDLPEDLRLEILGKVGQSTERPAGGPLHMRGDLVLMRMKKDLFEEKVKRPIEQNRQRQHASLDTLVARANDHVKQSLRRANQREIRDRHVFTTTDDPSFSSENVSESQTKG